MKTTDHAGVWIPPPLLFVIPLVVARMLNSRRPWLLVDDHVMALWLLGLVVVSAGVAVGLAGVAVFRDARTTVLPAGRPTTAIVQRGPYRFTRNPMYLAMALACAGLALLLNTMWALVLLPLVLAVIDRAVIRREERYLTAKFGRPYREYCARVRRWL
ncbi:MAG: methyltransferase [Acidobacteriota bacterium]|nr:methyltransferase [Acidobacteriota bacterium]